MDSLLARLAFCFPSLTMVHTDPCQYFFKRVIEIELITLFTLSWLFGRIMILATLRNQTPCLCLISPHADTFLSDLYIAKDGNNWFSSVHSQMHCGALPLFSLQFCLTPRILQEDPYGRRNTRHRMCCPCEDTTLAEHSHNCCWEPSASPMAVLKSLHKGADIWHHFHTLHNNLSGQASMLC